MQKYLCKRQQRSSINGSFSDWNEVIAGVPQCSILGPLLLDVFLNDIFMFILKCNLCDYANNTTLCFLLAKSYIYIYMIYIYMYMYIHIYMYIRYIYMYIFFYLFISICLSIYLSIYLSILSIYLSIFIHIDRYWRNSVAVCKGKDFIHIT